MSVELIMERILRDAGDQAQAARSAATRQAEQIILEAQQEAEARYERRMDAGRTETAAEVARIIAQARMEARETIRNTREELLDRCFEQAGEKLARIPESPEYPAILETLLDEGIRLIGDEEVRVAVHSRDLPLIRNITGRRDKLFVVSDQLEGTGGGLVITSSSGKVAVDNTFTGRLSRMRKDLVFRAAAVLFEGETR
jgi:vacuolar-type H+-ATPase subunit E/Vma4